MRYSPTETTEASKGRLRADATRDGSSAGSPTLTEPAPESRSPGSDAALMRFARRMRWILDDPAIRARVAASQIRVRIEMRDAPGCVAHLLFDQPVPSVVVDEYIEAPTIRLLMSSAELDRLFDTGTSLAMAILSEDVVFEGPVRKLLRVMPVLRGGALRIPDGDEVV